MKKIIKTLIFSLALLVCASGVLFVSIRPAGTTYADIINTTDFSAVYDDNVIFSVEKVLIPDTESTTSFDKTMITSTGTQAYYKDIKRGTANKYVIADGEFVMLDDMQTEGAIGREAIMVSLGAYQYHDGEYLTNSGDYYDQYLTAINFSRVTMNGQNITTDALLPARRQFFIGGQEYTDFVMFITFDDYKEGLYEFNYAYSRKVGGQVTNSTTKSFSFYLLSKKSFNKDVAVSGQTYNTAPTFSNTEQKRVSNTYGYKGDVIHLSDVNSSYPTLTYDYKKYRLTYVRNYKNVDTTYTLIYDNNKTIKVTMKSSLGESEYDINLKYTTQNSLLTIVFTELGEYTIDSQVIFVDQNTTHIVAENQVNVESQRLVNYSTLLTYRKDNVERELKQLTICQNGIDIYVPNAVETDTILARDNQYSAVYQTENTDARNGTLISEISAYRSDITVADNDISDINDLEIDYLKVGYAPISVLQNFNFDDNSFYYYGTKKGALDKKKYIKGKSFNDVGYYVVALRTDVALDYEGIDQNNIAKWQVYAFQISFKLSAPEMYTMTGDEPSDSDARLYSVEYTNKNVYIKWEKEKSIFERPTTAQYWYNVSYATQYNGVATALNNGDVLTLDGSYKVIVTNGSQSTTLTFKIDKKPISGLTLFGVRSTSTTDNVTYKVTENTYDGAVMDQMVTLRYNPKGSGAEIKAKYSFTPFVADHSVESKSLVTSQGTWVTTAYRLGKTQSDKTFVMASDINVALSVESVFSESGIYHFTLTDDAGNTCTYTFIIDKTEAGFVQSPKSDNELYNLVITDVTVTWGTHKAIKIDNNTTSVLEYLPARDQAYYDGGNKDTIGKYFDTYDLENYFIVRNTQAQVTLEGTSVTVNDDHITLEIEKKSYNALSGEGVYTIRVKGENQSNDLVDTRSKLSVELNADTSRGMIYASDTAGTYDANNRLYSSQGSDYSQATDAKYVVFEWDDTNEIESLTYDYYPVDNSNNNNHPYASLPTLSGEIIVAEDDTVTLEGRNGKRRSKLFNLSATIDGERVIAEGKYVITRVFATEVSNDSKTRTYTFYVDRNGIFAYSGDETVVGQNIKVRMQNDTVYTDFASEGEDNTYHVSTTDGSSESISAKTLFQTNKLPVQIIIPSSKYVLSNDNGALYRTSTIDAYKLRVELYYSSDRLNVVKKSFGTSKNNIIDLKDDSSITKPGIYVVRISDGVRTVGSHTVADNVNNTYVFAFEILGDKPTGDFYVNGGREKLDMSSTGVASSTSSDDITFVIKEPTSEYISKVDMDNLRIDRRRVGSSSWDTYYRIQEGSIKVGTADMVSTDGDQYIIKLESPVTVDDNGKIIDHIDYEYRAIIQYVGKADDYRYTNESGQVESFYSNTMSVSVDRTAPSQNLNNLMSKDSHYTAIYGGSIMDSVSVMAYRNTYGTSDDDYRDYYGMTMRDYYDEANKNYYAFAIDETTEFINNDVNEVQTVFVRKLAVDEGDFDPDDSEILKAQKSKLSLLPSDERYYSSEYDTYLRFDEANALFTKINLTGKYTYADLLVQYDASLLSGYYEIIEKDASGNMTSYAVYYNNTGSNMITMDVKYNNSLSTDTDRVLSSGEKLSCYSVTITGINNNDKYAVITLLNESAGTTKTFITTIGTDMSTVLSGLNEVLGYGENVITITNRYGENAVYCIQKFDNNSTLNISAINVVQSNGAYSIYPYHAVTYDSQSGLDFGISSLTLTEKNVSVSEETTDLAIWNDLNHNKLTLSQLSNWKIEIKLKPDAVYELVLVDVLGTSYKKTLYTMNVDIEQPLFLVDIINNGDIDAQMDTYNKLSNEYYFSVGSEYYTTKPLMIQYHSAQYDNVIIYRYNFDTDMYTVVGSQEIALDFAENKFIYKAQDKKNPTLQDLLFLPSTFAHGFTATGGVDRYKVVMTNASNNTADTYLFTIDNRSPEVNFYNMNNENKNTIATVDSDVSYNTTSESILIVWGDFVTNGFEYKVVLEKKVINDDFSISYLPIDITTSQNGYMLSAQTDEGTYVLHLYTYTADGYKVEDRKFAFTIRQTDNALYTVVYASDNTRVVTDYQAVITWDEIKRYINNTSATLPEGNRLEDTTEIPLYMSIEALELYTNADRQVTVERIVAPITYEGSTRNKYTINESGYELVLYRVCSMDISEYVYEEYVGIVKVPYAKDSSAISNSNKAMLVTMSINDIRRENDSIDLLKEGREFTWLAGGSAILTFNSYNAGNYDDYNTGKDDLLVKKNKIIADVYYNGKQTAMVSNDNVYTSIEFLNSGKYSLRFRDSAGNVVNFVQNDYSTEKFDLTVMKDMLVTVNDMPVLDNAMYNGDVKVTVENTSEYVATSLQFDVYYNGIKYNYTRSPFSFTFTQPGIYQIFVSGDIKQVVPYSAKMGWTTITLGRTSISKSFTFTIIDENEARLALDFTNISNLYTIASVEYKGNDITSVFNNLLNGADLVSIDGEPVDGRPKLITYSRLVSDFGKDNGLGIGKYTVTYTSINANRIDNDYLIPSQTITVTFWINQEVPSILSSIKTGKSTTKAITIRYNPYIINQQIGDCSIRINDVIYANINSDTAVNELQKIKLTDNDVYFVQIVSDSGMVISSFKVTKKAPLNATSIILIVIAALVVVGGTVTFIVLRKRVKIR